MTLAIKHPNQEEYQVADTPTTELRSQMAIHEGFVQWYGDTYGIDLNKVSASEVIARFAAKRNEFRKSEFYTGVKSDAVTQREAAKAERAEARAAAQAERQAEKEAAKAEKAAAAAAKKATAKKAAPAKQAAKKAPAKKAAPAKAAASSKGDDPFA